MTGWSKFDTFCGSGAALIGGAVMGTFGVAMVDSHSFVMAGIVLIGFAVFGGGIVTVIKAVRRGTREAIGDELQDHDRLTAYESLRPAAVLPEDMIEQFEDMFEKYREADEHMRLASEAMRSGYDIARAIIERLHEHGVQHAELQEAHDDMLSRSAAYEQAITALQVAQRRPPMRQRAPEVVREATEVRPMAEAPVPSVVRFGPNAALMASTASYGLQSQASTGLNAYIPSKHRPGIINEIAEKVGLQAVAQET